MRYVTEEDVQRLLPMGEAVRILRHAFSEWREGRAGNQARRRMASPGGATLHSMAGWCGQYMGTKMYVTGKAGANFFFFLFDRETGQPLAQFEANWLGRVRTGAASGVATDLFARPDARVLGVIGSGFQAESQIEAIRLVRPSITEVRVWSRTLSKRVGCDAADEAVRDADVVVTATSAKDPVVESAWIADGAHVNAIGSNHPQRRELPGKLIERASIVVADSIEACQVEAGDLLLAGIDWSEVRELRDCKPEWNNQRVSVFKSVGLGLEDVAVAGYVYERLTLAERRPGRNPATH